MPPSRRYRRWKRGTVLRFIIPATRSFPSFSRLTPAFLYQAARRALKRMAKSGDVKFDLIDAHYFYPDGVAAAKLARELEIPLLITGRGTDLTLIPQSAPERAQIQWACKQASALITVCEDLKDKLVELGEAPSRIVTLRNGVDLDRFSPGDRSAARARLGLTGFTLLSVGSLIPRKGHELIIAALADLPDAQPSDRRQRTDAIGAGENRAREGRRRTRSFSGRDRARCAHRCLPRRRYLCPRLFPRRLGQRAAGSDGVRHAGGGHQCERHARSRSRSETRRPGAGTLRRRAWRKPSSGSSSCRPTGAPSEPMPSNSAGAILRARTKRCFLLQRIMAIRAASIPKSPKPLTLFPQKKIGCQSFGH